MPQTYLNNSPATRFLDRGQQLMRLQGRVLKEMMAALEAEQQLRQETVITHKTNVKSFVRDVMAGVSESQARFADVELMFQLFFCRHVDNFQIFVGELLSDAVRRTPMLVSGLKLRKSDDRLPEDEKVERRLRKLSFMSLAELTETLRTQMQFELFADSALGSRVMLLYDIRNLITHQYGIVNRYFVSKHSTLDFEVGTCIPLNVEFIRGALNDLIAACGDIQKRATTKFGVVYETKLVGSLEWWEENDGPQLPDLPQPGGQT